MKTDIAVLGSGFSANAIVIHLLEQLEPSRSIAVIGDRQRFGLGVAYGAQEDCHRLNVPAGRMSLFADRPDHFLNWLKMRDSSHGSEDFIPRRIYGHYLRDSLTMALAQKDNRAKVDFIDARAIAFQPAPDGGHSFALSNGRVINVEQSVFCLGATVAGLPLPAEKMRVEDRFIVHNPWDRTWLDKVDTDETILVLGTGLTMIDQVLSLKARGHRGRIEAISRRGQLPLPHLMPRSHPLDAVVTPGRHEISDMLALLRQAAEIVEDWRSVVDGLRPITQSLWQNMTESQKRRFLRHAAPWWNIHRHRMGPAVAREITALLAAGNFTVRAGRLMNVGQAGSRIAVGIKDGKTGRIESMTADRLINCTGLERCAMGKVPILRNMMAKGLARSDCLGLGVDVSDQSEILTLDGQPQPGLYAAGPMTIGQFWEISAVPDIRQQVSRIACRIAGRA